MLVEYGDFQCPYCRAAHPVVAGAAAAATGHGAVRVPAFSADQRASLRRTRSRGHRVGRRQGDVLGHARLAVRPPGADLRTGCAWALRASGCGWSTSTAEVGEHVWADRVRRDFVTGIRSGVNGTPTFYVNGVRHDLDNDLDSLLAAVDMAAEAAARWRSGKLGLDPGEQAERGPAGGAGVHCSTTRADRPGRNGASRVPTAGTRRPARRVPVQPVEGGRAGQLPGAFLLQVAVGALDDRPDRRGRPAEVEVLQCRRDLGQRELHSGRANVPAAVAVDECRHPADEVADSAGEIVVGPRDQPREREVGVADAGHLPQEPPAYGVRAVLLGQRDGVDGRTRGFGDLAAVDGEIVVDQDVGGQGQARGQQDRGPVDGVEAQDALADQVDAAVGAVPPVSSAASSAP